MEIKNSTVVLEEAGGIEGYDFVNYVTFIESSGTKIKIPVKTLLRAHSILQFQVEKEGIDFEKFSREIMEKA